MRNDRGTMRILLFRTLLFDDDEMISLGQAQRRGFPGRQFQDAFGAPHDRSNSPWLQLSSDAQDPIGIIEIDRINREHHEEHVNGVARLDQQPIAIGQDASAE